MAYENYGGAEINGLLFKGFKWALLIMPTNP